MPSPCGSMAFGCEAGHGLGLYVPWDAVVMIALFLGLRSGRIPSGGGLTFLMRACCDGAGGALFEPIMNRSRRSTSAAAARMSRTTC